MFKYADRNSQDALAIKFAGDTSEELLDLTLHFEDMPFDERCDLTKSPYETVHWASRRETI